MEISKLRSDRVQEGKVSENKGAAAAKKSSELQDASELMQSQNATSVKTPENVKWSAEAELLAEGVQAAKESPDLRSEKIAQLKQAIQSGSYKIDAHGIADKMIQGSLEEDLISRKS